MIIFKPLTFPAVVTVRHVGQVVDADLCLWLKTFERHYQPSEVLNDWFKEQVGQLVTHLSAHYCVSLFLHQS